MAYILLVYLKMLPIGLLYLFSYYVMNSRISSRYEVH